MEDKKIIGIDESKICWTQYKNSNGETYEVGHLEGNDNGETDRALKSKTGFNISVDWNVGNTNWTETDKGSDVREKAAIWRYKLHPHTGDTYKYCLEISNTEHYDYFFHDASGHSYELNTYRNGDHWLRYNSTNPKISSISGT